jgi:hypothetical protein
MAAYCGDRDGIRKEAADDGGYDEMRSKQMQLIITESVHFASVRALC